MAPEVNSRRVKLWMGLARAGIFHTRVAADFSRRHFRGRKNAPTDVGGYILLTNRAKCELSRLAAVTVRFNGR